MISSYPHPDPRPNFPIFMPAAPPKANFFSCSDLDCWGKNNNNNNELWFQYTQLFWTEHSATHSSTVFPELSLQDTYDNLANS